MKRRRKGLLQAFTCAFRGVWNAADQRNFRIELGFIALCVALGFCFCISGFEWLVVLVCFGLVLGGECFNTALEAMLDLLHPEYHELARKAKDTAAGGVLLFSCASLLVGIGVFLPHIAALFTLA